MGNRNFLEKLFPKRKDFFQMLANQTSKVEEGLMALVDFMEKPDTGNVNRVNQLEEEADELRRILIDELNRTFVTPIDREDIFTLSRACSRAAASTCWPASASSISPPPWPARPRP